MGLFNFLNGKKNDNKPNANTIAQAASSQHDYTVLIQIADLLSGGDSYAIGEVQKLITDYSAFYSDHQEWCDEIIDDITELHNRTLVAFAYWMVGYDTDKSFGGYIDWKEETEDVLYNLRPAIATLGYPLDLDAIAFSGDEFTDEALATIDKYFAGQGYVLACLDTDSDCYHMFVIPESKYSLLVSLGKTVNFKFFRPSV